MRRARVWQLAGLSLLSLAALLLGMASAAKGTSAGEHAPASMWDAFWLGVQAGAGLVLFVWGLVVLSNMAARDDR